jgi:predicted pyridoxine 5'-phosphate oxidase superfamily flavin-nucleotide-binding protein
MRIPEKLVTRLRGGAVGTLTAYLTSSSRDGRTNTLASPFTDVVDGELVLMPDLFAQKTKVNLNENRFASLSFADEDGSVGWILEGRADVIQWGHPRSFRLFGLQAGEVLDRWGDWDEGVEPVLDAPDPDARPSVFAQRGVIVFKPERAVEVAS